MEPNWTKKISNETVCNFFYTFYLVYAVFAVISLVGFVSLFFFAKKMPKTMVIFQGLYGLLVFGIAVTMALFHYLICDRALKPGAEKMKGSQGFADMEEEEQREMEEDQQE